MFHGLGDLFDLPAGIGIQVGEIFIRREGCVDAGDIGGVAAVKKCAVDRGTADDKAVLRGGREQLVQIGKDLGALGGEGRVAGQDQVPAPLQGPAAGEGGQRLAP